MRAIGVSNFKPAQLQRLIDETGVAPEVNQIQLSPYWTRDDARAFHAEHGIVTEGWSPLGKRTDLLEHPKVAEIANAHGKTPGQVILRWHVELNVVPIPKSQDPQRLAQNLDVFDFKLTADQIATLSALDGQATEPVDSDAFGH